MQAFGLARLGRDCETRYTTSGDAVTSLSLAFAWGKKGDDGKRQTLWVEGSLWGKHGETLAPYLLKGGLVSVTLEDVHIQEFKKADGTPANKMVGKVTKVELAGGGGEQRAAAPPPPAPPPPPRRAPPPSPAGSHGFEDMDSDEIPF